MGGAGRNPTQTQGENKDSGRTEIQTVCRIPEVLFYIPSCTLMPLWNIFPVQAQLVFFRLFSRTCCNLLLCCDRLWISTFCFRVEMEGDDCSFPPDSSDDHSQRGSVASSATLSRGTVEQIIIIYITITPLFCSNSTLFSFCLIWYTCDCSHSSRCAHIPVWGECSPPICRRARQCHCAGAGPKCSWGSQRSWICTWCFCLLVMFSPAR